MPDAGGRARERALIALAAGLVALVVYLSDDNHVQSGDTYPARLLPLSILDEGDLDFNEFEPLAAPGRRIEEHYMFVRVGRRVLSYYSIVPGLLNLPAHWIDRRLGRDSRAHFQQLSRLTASVVTALSVGFVAWTLLGLCARTETALLFAALYAFGTSAWSVAATALWQHGPSLLFLSAAIAALGSSRRLAAAGAGFALGMAVWNRLPNAVFALPLAGYVGLCRPRDLAAFAVGAALPALALFSYSWTHWGSPLAFGQGHTLAGIHGAHQTGFGGPVFSNLAGLLVSPNRGLFVFSPVLLLALPGLAKVLAAPRREPLLFALSLGALGATLLHALWSVWWGGYCFGYRLLTETAPVWILLLALSFETWIARSRPALLLFGLLALLSVYVHFLGAHYYPSGWNDGPVSIDDEPGRVWDLRDTQIGRLHRRFWTQLTPSD